MYATPNKGIVKKTFNGGFNDTTLVHFPTQVKRKLALEKKAYK